MKTEQNLKEMSDEELEKEGYGKCDECGKIEPIERGDNFFWNNKLEKWHCEGCMKKHNEEDY